MRKISEKNLLKEFKWGLLKQPRFHVEYFMTCALLAVISEFGLASYPKMLVLEMLAIWQSIMLLSSKQTIMVANSWTIDMIDQLYNWSYFTLSNVLYLWKYRLVWIIFHICIHQLSSAGITMDWQQMLVILIPRFPTYCV